MKEKKSLSTRIDAEWPSHLNRTKKNIYWHIRKKTRWREIERTNERERTFW